MQRTISIRPNQFQTDLFQIISGQTDLVWPYQFETDLDQISLNSASRSEGFENHLFWMIFGHFSSIFYFGNKYFEKKNWA